MPIIDITNKCTITPLDGTYLYNNNYINVSYNDRNNIHYTNLRYNVYDRNDFNSPFNFSDKATDGNKYFHDCYNFNQPVKLGNNLLDCTNMFVNCYKFNQDIRIPDSVTNLLGMFNNCNGWSNKNIYFGFCGGNEWNQYSNPISKTGLAKILNNGSFKHGNIIMNDNITGSLANLFSNYRNFNTGIKISNNINNCYYMFRNCWNFNQPVTIPDKVVNVRSMFFNCLNFNSPLHIGNGVTDIYGMLLRCYNFNSTVTFGNGFNITSLNNFFNCPNEGIAFNQVINIPNSVTDISKMFANCYHYNKPFVIPNNVNSVYQLFYNCTSFNQNVTIPKNLTNIHSMLYGSGFNAKIFLHNDITSYEYMYYGCYNFNQNITVPNRVTNVRGIVADCTNFNSNIIFHNNITKFDSVFWGCTNFNRPVSIPVVANDLKYVFYGCTNFNQPINIPENITAISTCFYKCSKFNQPLVLTNNIKGLDSAFSQSGFNQPINIPANAAVSSMLASANNFNQPNMHIWGDDGDPSWGSLDMFYSEGTPENPLGPFIGNLYIHSNNFNVWGMFNAYYLNYIQHRPSRINIYVNNFTDIDYDNLCQPYNYDSYDYENDIEIPQIKNMNYVPTWNTDITGCMYNSDFNIYIYNNLNP